MIPDQLFIACGGLDVLAKLGFTLVSHESTRLDYTKEVAHAVIVEHPDDGSIHKLVVRYADPRQGVAMIEEEAKELLRRTRPTERQLDQRAAEAIALQRWEAACKSAKTP